MTWREEALAELATDEGLRLRPYLDTKGKITIGYGRNLSANGISRAEADMLLANDFDNALHDCETHVKCWSRLDLTRRKAVHNLMFNMGWTTLATFTTFWLLMDAGKYMAAAHDLATTLWAHEIQPSRVDRIVKQLLGAEETQSDAKAV
jgi:lysozyme